MRANDLKVQTIARATGMLYMKDGKEYGTNVKADDLTMEFGYETPDEVAYVAVYKEGKRRPVNCYTEDFEDVEIEFPQFF
jgi:hypothetical protein